MKKSRLLTAVVAASMITMGAGYAAWTDSIAINNTVSTGTLDVNFKNPTVTAMNANNEGVANASAVVGDDVATITVKNVYPGATVKVTLPIQNDGTIPVKDGKITLQGAPEWLTVTAGSVPTLAVNEKKDITIDMLVGEDAPQGGNATFTGTATYNQFNK